MHEQKELAVGLIGIYGPSANYDSKGRCEVAFEIKCENIELASIVRIILRV